MNARSDDTQLEDYIKNAELLHVSEAAELKVAQHDQKIAKVTQSVSTETATNAVFFSVAAYLGFEGLGWAAVGTGLVYLRLYQTYRRPWLKRDAIQNSQKRFNETQNPSEFNGDRLTHKQTVKFDDQSAYSAFFSKPEAAKDETPSKFDHFYQNVGHVSGAVIGKAFSRIRPASEPYWANFTEKAVARTLIKSTDILAEPLPERAVLFRSNQYLRDNKIERWDAKRWGIIGSVVDYGANLGTVAIRSAAKTNFVQKQLQRSFVKNARPIVLMDDPAYKPPRRVLRTLFKTSRYTGVSQIPANKEEREESRDAEIQSRKGDYKEMFWNAVGVGGAFEFTAVVTKNVISNMSSPDTLNLAALWALTAWVSLDPLKHMLDDQRNITKRIEDANESIDGHDDVCDFMDNMEKVPA
ncbi:MAG: hypothetical protein AB8B83_06475 [Bdellovibrionales bacterium]